MDRVILHCDLNNFFASVTLLENETLRDMPVAICGSKEERHGIVLAKNEIAKSYGVKTAEAIWQAEQKCPSLVILPPNYRQYEYYSAEAKKIYAEFTDKVEPFGIDECWLDVTGSVMLFGSGEEIAEKIRKEIKRRLSLTVSVGVSFNKVFAKLGSDMKKPDAVTVISRKNFKDKVWPLSVGEILFAGKKTVEKLQSLGIFTLGDLAEADNLTLSRAMGKNGVQLKNYALGLDNSPVAELTHHRVPKSIGRSVTVGRDFKSRDEVWKTVLSLSEEIWVELRREGLCSASVQVHTRDSSLKSRDFTESYNTVALSSVELAHRAMQIFSENYSWELPLRSIGVRAVNLKSEVGGVQTDLFSQFEKNRRLEQIEESLFTIREKYGADSLKRAATMDVEYGKK